MSENANNEISFDEAFAEFAGDSTTANVEEVTEGQGDTSTETNANNTETVEEISTEGQDTAQGGEESTQTLTAEEATALAKQWENKFKSYQGRMNVELEKRREEELVRQQQFIDLLSKNNVKTDIAKEEPKKMSPKFQALMDDFPELAGAVEELLNQRLEDTKSMVTQVVDQRVMPVMANMEQQRVSNHMEKILSRHPDAYQLKQEGDLDKWINTLPIFMRKAADGVLKAGSADEVVALLDQYKTTVDTKKQNTQNTDKPATKEEKSSAEILNAVKGGLAVKGSPSGNPKTEQRASRSDDWDSGWNKFLDEHGIK